MAGELHVCAFPSGRGCASLGAALRILPTFLLLALLLLGCAEHRTVVLEALSGRSGAEIAAPGRVSGAVGRPAGTGPAEISLGPGQGVRAPEAEGAGAEPGDVSLDFTDTDVRTLAAEVLGRILRVNYTIDPAVRGSATLRTAAPIPRVRVLPALEAALEGAGASIIQSGGLYRVIPEAALAASGLTPAETGTAGSTVVGLRYAGAADLARVLQPFVGAGGRIVADPAHNALLVSGEPATRQALVSLIRSFDVEILAGQSYAVLPTEGGGVRELATALETALRGGAPASLVRAVPLERLGAVLVVAADPGAVEAAQRVFALVQRRRGETARSWHVFYLGHGRSNEVAAALQQALTPGRVTARDGGDVRAAPSITQPGAQARGAGAAEGEMRVVPNPANDAVLVLATAAEAETVEAMLRRMDVARRQVRIDATVAEVTLAGALQYGTQFFLKGAGVNAALSAGPSASSFASGVPGFVLSGNNGGGAALAALSNATAVRVLSTPQVLVLDNEWARLEVGDLVPYLTSRSQSTVDANSPVVNGVGYKQTGVVLGVRPLLGRGGQVTLDIAESVSDVASTTTTGGIASPTFDERNIVSRVSLADGQTVGIAGVVRDSEARGNEGIPGLRSIPGLGVAAGQQSNSRQRTELVVLITPHIEEVRPATGGEDLRQSVIRAATELRGP